MFTHVVHLQCTLPLEIDERRETMTSVYPKPKLTLTLQFLCPYFFGPFPKENIGVMNITEYTIKIRLY